MTITLPAKPHRILVITSVYPLNADGNQGAFIRERILQLKSRTEYEFSVFAPAQEASKGYDLDGIKIHRFRYFLKPFENLVGDGAPTKLQKKPLYLIVAVLYIILGTLQLFWLCLRSRPDILQVNWPFPHGLMALPASKLLGIPMVFSFYGAELLLKNKFSFVEPILRWLIPQARVVTSNSSYTQGLVAKLTDKPVTIVYDGLTIEAKPDIVYQPGEIPQLLFVARLDERKGLRYLLEALPQILATQPVRLRIVGKGILEAELKAQCQALNLDSVVDFLGFVTKEELAAEYAACAVFVLPSIVDSKGDTEGLGVVTLEALAHGKPVVVTNVGGIRDTIIPEKTGFLVPEKNPEALAQAILTLLANPKLAAEMGQLGKLDVKNRFSWDSITSLWQRVFAEALNPKSFQALVEQ